MAEAEERNIGHKPQELGVTDTTSRPAATVLRVSALLPPNTVHVDDSELFRPFDFKRKSKVASTDDAKLEINPHMQEKLTEFQVDVKSQNADNMITLLARDVENAYLDEDGEGMRVCLYKLIATAGSLTSRQYELLVYCYKHALAECVANMRTLQWSANDSQLLDQVLSRHNALLSELVYLLKRLIASEKDHERQMEFQAMLTLYSSVLRPSSASGDQSQLRVYYYRVIKLWFTSVNKLQVGLRIGDRPGKDPPGSKTYKLF